MRSTPVLDQLARRGGQGGQIPLGEADLVRGYQSPLYLQTRRSFSQRRLQRGFMSLPECLLSPDPLTPVIITAITTLRLQDK